MAIYTLLPWLYSPSITLSCHSLQHVENLNISDSYCGVSPSSNDSCGLWFAWLMIAWRGGACEIKLQEIQGRALLMIGQTSNPNVVDATLWNIRRELGIPLAKLLQRL